MAFWKRRNKKKISESIMTDDYHTAEYKAKIDPPPPVSRPASYYDQHDYTLYSRCKSINIIPENDFKNLVVDTFHTLTDALRVTYGPYGRQVMISDHRETTTTKDGYNTFAVLGFADEYKDKVYLAIKKICDRVNRRVGDGTTSCILLAEKMFNEISQILKTPDDQRLALKILNKIERDLQSNDKLENDISFGIINKLSMDSFKSLISVADNYDNELADVLVEAFSPTVDDNGYITSVRNVVTEDEVDEEDDTNIQYSVEPLPGKYRVRVNMLNLSFAYSMSTGTKIKIIVFDHLFTNSDWDHFYQTYDRDKEELTLICARAFAAGFIDTSYSKFLKNRAAVKLPVNIILAEIKGTNVQNEIKDFAAVIGTVPYKLNTTVPINHNDLPTVDVMMYGANCLCVMNAEPPTEYIHDLELEMKKDLSKSYINKKMYMDRINALKMDGQGDTLLKIKGGSTLEVKFIADKIMDCTSIVQSALVSGIVPNVLKYAHTRMDNMIPSELCPKREQLASDIVKATKNAIEGLFMDIWRSKYLSDNDVKGIERCKDFYDTDITGMQSFDIVEDVFVKRDEFPTSSQYDLEVVVAALHIVKYLLTSGAFIFDAYMQRRGGIATAPQTAEASPFQFNRPEA